MGCSNRSCGCVKRDSKCGPVCKCRNCRNNTTSLRSNVIPIDTTPNEEDNSLRNDSNEDMTEMENDDDNYDEFYDISDSESEQSDIETEIITPIEHGDLEQLTDIII